MQVSLAAYGSSCAGRPAAALDVVRNFTAAAALQANFAAGMQGPQRGAAGVLAGYAENAAQHFERAKRVCKTVPLSVAPALHVLLQGGAVVRPCKQRTVHVLVFQTLCPGSLRAQA